MKEGVKGISFPFLFLSTRHVSFFAIFVGD